MKFISATNLNRKSGGAKRGICSAPRSLPDSQGQTYRQFQPSLFVPRRHCFYLQTHLFIRSEARDLQFREPFLEMCSTPTNELKPLSHTPVRQQSAERP